MLSPPWSCRLSIMGRGWLERRIGHLRPRRKGGAQLPELLQRAPQQQRVAGFLVARGRQARVLMFDVADRGACARALAADIGAHGAYHGVVCNAGITRDAAFPAMTGEEWDAVIHTNLDGFYNVLQPCVMPMVRRRRPGRIVTIASVSGLVGNRGQTNYSAAKGGLIAATKALALELAKREITVNCVAPGLVDTEMLPAEVVDEALKLVPLRRVGRPEEVAAAVSYLVADDAGYVTRQVISVNGGMA